MKKLISWLIIIRLLIILVNIFIIKIFIFYLKIIFILWGLGIGDWVFQGFFENPVLN